MKAAAFDYVRAESIEHASRLLAEGGEDARVIAGGQSLLPALNLRLQTPALLIDIGRLGLRDIEPTDGGLRVGALVRHVDLLRSPRIAAHAPLLRDAARHIAHPAIRNRGTLGGSLAHADPASELPACMLALRATIIVSGSGGERRIAACDFFTGIFETALRQDEIITGVEVLTAPSGQRTAFAELARRSGDFAIAGLACCAVLDKAGAAKELRLAFFGVGDRPVLATRASAALTGRVVNGVVVAEARARLADDLDPQSDLQASRAMRLHLAGVLMQRVLAEIFPAAATHEGIPA